MGGLNQSLHNRSQVQYMFCVHRLVNCTEGFVKTNHSWTYFHRSRKVLIPCFEKMKKKKLFSKVYVTIWSTRKFTVTSKGISCITKPRTQSSCKHCYTVYRTTRNVIWKHPSATRQTKCLCTSSETELKPSLFYFIVGLCYLWNILNNMCI